MVHNDMEVPKVNNNSAALFAALEHARVMANWAAEVRMRNFNFYILLTGALVTGYTQLPVKWWMVLALAGTFTSALFVGLDIRVYGLLKRSMDQLKVLESALWQLAELEWQPIPQHGGMQWISHTWIYRTFFVSVGIMSIVAFVLQHFVG